MGKRLHDWRIGNQWFFKKSILITVFLLVSITLIGGPATVQSAEKTYVLKAVSAFSQNDVALKGVPKLIEMVEKESQGRLKIKWLGGPEVTKAFDQPEALRTGLIDMILYIPTSYFKGILPVADCKGLSQLTSPQERKTGAFALWEEVFRKFCNAEHLGFWVTDFEFEFFTVDKIASLSDFKGKTLRVMPLYAPFTKALGASPVVMPPPEIYTALQRKVVDGFMWLEMGITPLGWHELIKYRLSPKVFRGESTVAVNLDKFNSLPKDLQDILKKCMATMEIESDAILKEVLNKEEKLFDKMGIQVVTLPPEEAKTLVALSQDVTWAEIIKKSPVYGPKFRELTRKEAYKE
ncbi:MAG TPA: TRAP transporter substrate-binding protein DctP [Syntrophales bacterium]|nr:TRAP transporter substrate-binding protein DctP [Syntrophales bacterium]HPQ45653.1 TRAP transporter substrate-binding protein DctP [Syntrophales bacterium]